LSIFPSRFSPSLIISFLGFFAISGLHLFGKIADSVSDIDMVSCKYVNHKMNN